MSAARQDVAASIATVLRRRPALASVLRAFEPVFAAREKMIPEIAELLRARDVRPPAFRADLAKAGVPLLAEMRGAELAGKIKTAAAGLLPLLAAFTAIAPYREKLASFFISAEDNAEALAGVAECLLGRPGKNLEACAQTAGVPLPVMDFAAGFIFSAVFRALVSLIPVNATEEKPWDAPGLWKEGYCPACGSAPVIAWLDKPVFDEKNAFLAGGGGKKHYHCPMCAANWKFRRGVCPACGAEGDGAISILNEEGAMHERLEWCAKCETYCPVVDLREMADFPDMDVMALGMLHLDMIAARKDLHPLKLSFWNMF